MHYLLTNLRVQAIVIGAACLSMAALAVVLIQEALGSAAQRLLAEASHQCRNAAAELRAQWLEQQAYRSEPTGPLPFAARDLSLRGLTRTVLRSFEGVQGGFWLPEPGGVIGFSDPSVEEDGNPQLAPGAWLATLAHAAAESGEVQVRTWESGYEGFALAVEPPSDGIAAWASKRLPDLRDPVGRTRRWWAAGLLLCALLAVGGVISITLRLQRDAASLSAGLQRMEQDLNFRLPPISGDFGTIAEAVNRMADRRTGLEGALRRQDRLAALGRVVAGVAHEIRNPLNSLRLTMELLRRRAARAGSPTGEAEAAVHEIDRLDDILSRFLAFGRQELGARKVQPVAPLLERVQRIAQSAAASRGVTVDLEAPGPMPEADIDSLALEQVLLNLLLNAIEAAPASSHVVIRCSATPGEAVLEVHDQGPGIEAEIRDHIFDPYFTTKPDGSGLGLAVSRELVLRHEGSLEMESAGNGTTFTVRLPLRRNAA